MQEVIESKRAPVGNWQPCTVRILQAFHLAGLALTLLAVDHSWIPHWHYIGFWESRGTNEFPNIAPHGSYNQRVDISKAKFIKCFIHQCILGTQVARKTKWYRLIAFAHSYMLPESKCSGLTVSSLFLAGLSTSITAQGYSSNNPYQHMIQPEPAQLHYDWLQSTYSWSTQYSLLHRMGWLSVQGTHCSKPISDS